MRSTCFKSLSAALILITVVTQDLFAFAPAAGAVFPASQAHGVSRPFQNPSYTEDTNIVGLAISTIQGQQILNPQTTLETAFANIRPDLVTSLERYGVEKLSSSIGLPPIVGQTLGSAVSNTINVAWAGGANVGQNIISSVNQGLTHGIVSYGINFVGNSNPILGSLLSPDIQNSIEQSIGPSVSGAIKIFFELVSIILPCSFRFTSSSDAKKRNFLSSPLFLFVIQISTSVTFHSVPL